ncbi:MAG: hypothetical protein KF892_09980 [Rhizobacter sp.]|nr:hypothetical protein [Rhizobacter sp.]
MKLLEATSAGAASSPEMRRAALLLHSMSAADRAWTLEQLSTEDRSRLVPLLSELSGLGIPGDPALVSDALNATAAPGSPHEQPHNTTAQALLREPDRLIVTLLRCGPWAWQASLFAALTPARRRSIEAALRTATEEAAPAPALRDALIDGVRTRSAQATNAASTESAQPPWQRAWRQLATRFAGTR